MFKLLSWCNSPFFNICKSSPECYRIETLDANGQSLEKESGLPWSPVIIIIIIITTIVFPEVRQSPGTYRLLLIWNILQVLKRKFL